MKHNFHESLKKGQAAEAQFLALFKDKLERTDGRTVDFIIISNKKSIEIKTDFYDPAKTENVFMERWSREGVDGGPYQALAKGADYYVYWMPFGKKFFVYDTKQLVGALDKILPTLKIIGIPNYGYTTYGYKVPRSLLAHLQLNLEDIL